MIKLTGLARGTYYKYKRELRTAIIKEPIIDRREDLITQTESWREDEVERRYQYAREHGIRVSRSSIERQVLKEVEHDVDKQLLKEAKQKNR